VNRNDLQRLAWMAACGPWLVFASHAQDFGGAAGVVVSSWDGRPLPLVTVTVRGTTLAGQTDPAGRYEIRGIPIGDQVLRFTKPGHAGAVVTDVRILPGQVTTVNGNLRPEFYEFEEFEVTAEEFNEQTSQILGDRRDAAGLMDAIGSEQFTRVGASDAADIVSKVPGITVTDGKSPVVRGLNERYVGITLNGAEVPSADPYRKSVSLDLFPAGLIERVVVAKSFTPDLTGNSTGGGINLITRSFPERFVLIAGAGLEYNTQSTFADEFQTYKGGGLDWLAMDDGTRELPESLKAPLPLLVTTTLRPNQVGFEQQLETIGRLIAVSEALGPAEFGPTLKAPPPNQNLNFSMGDTVQVKERRLGLFGGMNYRRNYSHLIGEANRFVPSGTPGILVQRRGGTDIRSIEEINWAAIANIAYEISEGHEVGFNFLFNQNAEDLVRQQVGFDNDSSNFFPFVQNRLIWTERNLSTYQLRGSHLMPEASDLEISWLGAYSTTTQDEPDARFFNYTRAGRDFFAEGNFLPTPTQPTRYFRALSEDNLNGKIDLKRPITFWRDLDGYFKAGLFDSESERSFTDREFFYQPQSNPGGYGAGSRYPFLGDPNSFFPEGVFVPDIRTNANGSRRYTWHRVVQGRQSLYEAQQSVRAAYMMMEVPIVSRLKFTGGVRLESTEIDVFSVGALRSAITGQQTNTTNIRQVDWLPAAGITWTPITNMNVRLNFGQTVARPSFRELAAYRQYDPVLNELLEGNPLLTMSSVNNYDFRWEWFPNPGAVLSVSLFQKDIRNAIERQFITVDGEIVSFSNRGEAEVRGVEVEARHGLGFLSDHLEGISLGMNASYIRSKVQLTEAEISNRTSFLGDSSETRPLFDQSPYIFNADVTWEVKRWGTSFTAVASVFGPRITIAGLATPDIYEQPAPQLDFIVSQRIGEHFKLRFTARNVLDPTFQRTYGKDAASPVFQDFKRGMAFGLSLGYEF
jgi:outer membrane receptor protein involved in Fe transport